jgi:general secretion pathway protein I
MKRGFTLLEVMVALALLGLGMVVLIKSTAGNIFSTEDAHMMGIATDLARGKMYDIEEILLKDGFTDSDQSQESEKCFDDEGWPNICYSYKVEEPELPSFDQIQQLAQKQAADAAKSAAGSAGSALGSDVAAAGGFENSALGSMMGMMGSLGGGKQDITAQQGASLFQSQYSMFQEILKVSIRKVTLTVKWKVLGRDRDMRVVAYFTDAAAMDKVLSGMGSQEYDPNGNSGGTGSGGSGSGSGSGSGTTGGGGSGRPSGGGRGSGG